MPSSDVEAETFLKIIRRRVSEGSTIYTGCFKAYLGLGEAGYRHEAVNHSAGEWAKGECHINSCESRASLLRPWLQVHRGICKENIKPIPSCIQGMQALQRDELHGSHQGTPKDHSYSHRPTNNFKKPPQPRNNHSKGLATTFLFMSVYIKTNSCSHKETQVSLIFRFNCLDLLA